MKTLREKFPQSKLKSRITPADPPENLPKDAKWLSGHGQGIWFHITKPEELSKNEFRVKRIALDGVIDCDRVFKSEESVCFDLSKEYKIGHISHCQKCTIIQNNNKFEIVMVREYNS